MEVGGGRVVSGSGWEGGGGISDSAPSLSYLHEEGEDWHEEEADCDDRPKGLIWRRHAQANARDKAEEDLCLRELL